MPESPKIAYLDFDMALFRAAYAAEDTVYRFVRANGEVVKEFSSASSSKQWLEEVSIFGVCPETSYSGSGDDLTREVCYTLHDVKKAYKAFDKLIDEHKGMTGCESNLFYVSKASGTPNFRHKIATLQPYKGNRQGRKPAALEAVRKHAYTHPDVKVPRGSIEVDDRVMAMARKAGERGLVVAGDKDVLQASGCWVLHLDNHESPVWSDPASVGCLYNKDGKADGLGWLWLLHQCIVGDSADNYAGVKGCGPKVSLEVLSKYSHHPIERIIEPITAVATLYHDVYGDNYTYFNHQTQQEHTASWRDILIEMMHLAYMRDKETVECPLINIVKEI